MTQTTEDKARALVNEVLAESNQEPLPAIQRERLASHEALCRVIEQHEAYKQDVSDALREWFDRTPHTVFSRFIIPKPTVDPLVRVVNEVIYAQPHGDIDEARMAADIHEALAKRGLKIVEDV